MADFPSSAWVDAWVRRANNDPAFVAAGHGFDGAVGAVIKPDVAWPVRPLYLRLEGANGTWTKHDLGSDPALVDETLFTISAEYLAWKSVIRHDLDPIRGLVLGRLRVRGQLSSVLRWARAFRLMTALAADLPTTFLDENPS